MKELQAKQEFFNIIRECEDRGTKMQLQTWWKNWVQLLGASYLVDREHEERIKEKDDWDDYMLYMKRNAGNNLIEPLIKDVIEFKESMTTNSFQRNWRGEILVIGDKRKGQL